MIKRVLKNKSQIALKNIETIRKKPTASLTPDEIKQLVIFISTQMGIIK